MVFVLEDLFPCLDSPISPARFRSSLLHLSFWLLIVGNSEEFKVFGVRNLLFSYRQFRSPFTLVRVGTEEARFTLPN